MSWISFAVFAFGGAACFGVAVYVVVLVAMFPQMFRPIEALFPFAAFSTLGTGLFWLASIVAPFSLHEVMA